MGLMFDSVDIESTFHVMVDGAALDSAFLSFRMARKHRAYNPGEGVVGVDVERTIHGVGLIGREGMDETDQHILRVMLQD